MLRLSLLSLALVATPALAQGYFSAETVAPSQSAEALRLTAAAPQRNNNAGGDYEG